MYVVMSCRELAYQIAEQFRVLGKPLGLRDCIVVGGMGNYLLQESALVLKHQCSNATAEIDKTKTAGGCFETVSEPLLCAAVSHRHGASGPGADRPTTRSRGDARAAGRSHPQLQHRPHEQDPVSGQFRGFDGLSGLVAAKPLVHLRSVWSVVLKLFLSGLPLRTL